MSGVRAVNSATRTRIAHTNFLQVGRRLSIRYLINMKQSLYMYLRNEFHFSGVHGAMNRSGSRAK